MQTDHRIVYRLYVASTDYRSGHRAQDALGIVAALGYEGATAWSAMGLWKGKRESSVVVEITVPDDRGAIRLGIYSLAEALRVEFDQESVGIVWHGITTGYVIAGEAR